MPALIPYFFIWRHATVRRVTKLPLYHLPHILSREKPHKDLIKNIPKLVQYSILIFLKIFDIIILSRGERKLKKGAR